MKGQSQGKYHDGNYYYTQSHKLLSLIDVKIVEIKQNYEYLTKRYDEIEKAYQDLVHYIEFANLNVVEGYKVMKKLKDIRIERRLIKSELEESKIANEIFDNMVVDQLLKQMRKAQGDCVRSSLDFTKSYSPRNSELTGITEDKFRLAQEKYNKELKESVVIFK